MIRRRLLALFVCSLIANSTAWGATLTVNAGGDLQAAIDAAQPGDTIVLQAGATFTGPFKLRVKNGSAYITIRSSTPDSQLPPAGTRITPAHAPLLAKIKPGVSGSAIQTVPGASYWRLQFLEVLPVAGAVAEDLVLAGEIRLRTEDVAGAVPGGRLHGEERIDQVRASERHEIGAAGSEKRVHLVGRGDVADADRRDIRLVADLVRERALEHAAVDRLRLADGLPGRHVDEIDARRFAITRATIAEGMITYPPLVRFPAVEDAGWTALHRALRGELEPAAALDRMQSAAAAALAES